MQNNVPIILKKYKIFFWRIFFALSLLTLSRIYFYIWNTNIYQTTSSKEILLAFIYGIRFDFYSFVVIGSIFILLEILPFNQDKNKFTRNLSLFFYVFSIFISLLFNAIDTDYIKFSGKRSTFDFFSIVTTGDEVINMIPQFIFSYWYHTLFVLLLTFLSIKFYKKSCHSFSLPISLKNVIISILIAIVIFFLVRGFDKRPLSIIDATTGNATTVTLVLNTTFTMLQTITQENMKPLNLLPLNKAKKMYHFLKQYKSNETNQRKNVVIIILESFGKEYIGFYNKSKKTHTPFLDSLLSESLTFKYSFANAKKSMEAIPAILASIPNLTNNPFILSPFATNKINSIFSVLKKHGYHTAFFHGGQNGTMNFNKFCTHAQVDEYYGMNEYPEDKKKVDYDGTWGIYDEPFLQFFANKLSEFKQPFVAALFTLSSHHPFSIPKKYKDRFIDKENELPVMKTIEYTDMALRNFFDKAKKTNWFENTLFVFVADHTSWSKNKKYQTVLGKFSILLAYYSSSDTTLKGISQTITQQIDIFPSIINYLGYEDIIYSVGNSTFSSSDKHIAFGYLSSTYYFVNKDYVCLFNGEKKIGVYNYKTDWFLRHNLKNSSCNCDTLKAILTIFSNDLYYNKMTP